MSLHDRKQFQETIDGWKNVPMLPSVEHIEERALESALRPYSSTSYAEHAGSLEVFVAMLLEHVKRADPAYGLTPVSSLTLRVDEDTFNPPPSDGAA